jgi:hypothetical protein
MGQKERKKKQQNKTRNALFIGDTNATGGAGTSSGRIVYIYIGVQPEKRVRTARSKYF